VSNAPAGAALGRLLRVGFGWWDVEHSIRSSKGEVGFRDFQGRHYVALMRPLVLCLVTLTFTAGQAARLRGEKSRGDVEPTVRGLVGCAAGGDSVAVHGGGHPVSPAA
jgi:hypothetical protein